MRVVVLLVAVLSACATPKQHAGATPQQVPSAARAEPAEGAEHAFVLALLGDLDLAVAAADEVMMHQGERLLR